MPNKDYKQIVICPVCDNVQEEIIMEGDKFAYICRRCSAAVEGDSTHLLQDEAEYSGPSGNICAGFGAKLGRIFHRRWYKNG